MKKKNTCNKKEDGGIIPSLGQKTTWGHVPKQIPATLPNNTKFAEGYGSYIDLSTGAFHDRDYYVEVRMPNAAPFSIPKKQFYDTYFQNKNVTPTATNNVAQTTPVKKYGGRINLNEPMYKELGLGSWIKNNSSDLKTAAIGWGKGVLGAGLIATGVGAGIGAGLMASGVGDIAGAAGSMISDPNKDGQVADATQLQNKELQVNALQGRLQNEYMAKGGFINYKNGARHSDPIGGIPVDQMGNPATNGTEAIVEKGEVTYVNPEGKSYVISRDNAKEFMSVVRRYKGRLGKDLQKRDALATPAFHKEAQAIVAKNEAERPKNNEQAYGNMPMAEYGMPLDNYQDPEMNIESWMSNPVGFSGNKSNGVKDSAYELYNPMKEMLPYAGVQGAATILSGVADSMAYKNSKPKNINPSYIQAPTYSYEADRQSARDVATTSRNTGLSQLRNLGVTKGAYMSGAAGITTGVQRNLSDTLSKSYQNEENINNQTKLAADQANAQSKDRANMFNSQRMDQYNANYVPPWSGVVPAVQGVTKDIQTAQSRGDYMNMYSSRTGYRIVIDPETGKKRFEAIPEFWDRIEKLNNK